MAQTLRAARAAGVAVGAHPGFDDLRGFGRRPIPMAPPEVERLIAYQIGALMGIAALTGHRVTHVKAHGALSNMACVDDTLADAIARAIRAVDPGLIFYVLPATALARAGARAGLRLAHEIFADRAYRADATLVPRGQPGAMIHDPALAAANVLRMVEAQAVFAIDGARVPVEIDTVCVHGDGPAALAIASAVRARLEAAGVAIKALAPTACAA